MRFIDGSFIEFEFLIDVAVLHGNHTGNTLSFDSTVVMSSQNLEGSFVSPTFVPGVDDSPIGSSVFNTPSDHLDSMSSQSISGFVLVNSFFISQKVRVNSEGDFNGSTGHDFGLELFNVRWN